MDMLQSEILRREDEIRRINDDLKLKNQTLTMTSVAEKNLRDDHKGTLDALAKKDR